MLMKEMKTVAAPSTATDTINGWIVMYYVIMSLPW